MQLVRIVHCRCNESTGTNTYVWAPASLSRAQIQHDVNEAVADYWKEWAERQEQRPVDSSPSPWPDYREPAFQTLTVAEVQTLQKSRYEKFKEWRATQYRLVQSFGERLRERGYISLWGYEDGYVEVEADWGHHHGDGPAKTSTTETDHPSNKIAEVEAENPYA